MSITSSFYSGLSGLDTHATAIQVIGDNISNIHSTGFKNSGAHFQDLLGVSLTGVTGSNQTGAGSEVASVDTNFIQGSLETTDVGTDLAINGKGLFIVGDPYTDELFYTRAGHFTIDNQGYYVNNQGYRVQGYLYDSTGTNLIENLADIMVDQNSKIAPKVTGEINMVLNLDASEDIKTWDINDASDTSHYSTALTIYDSLGQSHQIQVYFTKTADQTWQWHGVIDGADVQGGTSGVLQEYGTGTIAFDQDGYAAGAVSSVSIDEEGNFIANYTNGTLKKVARLALADFPNINGLARKGATLFQATTASGDPLCNKPGLGSMGNIVSSSLEESNVDLASEFIKMIMIQRGYQANTKVIATTDEMLAQLINIR